MPVPTPPHWRDVARRLETELNVNVSRHGVISLPVVRVGPPESEVARRIAEPSRAFYRSFLSSRASRGHRRSVEPTTVAVRWTAQIRKPREDHNADKIHQGR